MRSWLAVAIVLGVMGVGIAIAVRWEREPRVDPTRVVHEGAEEDAPTDERDAAEPTTFATVAEPRRLCGDPQEALVRPAIPALPSCADAPDLVYVAGHAHSGDRSRPLRDFVVAVGRGDGWGVVGGEVLADRDTLTDVLFPTEDDRRAAFVAVILWRRGNASIATSPEGIPSTLDAASRERLARAPMGMENGTLRAVGWWIDSTPELMRYEVSLNDWRSCELRTWLLEPDGSETDLTEDPGPVGALDGL